MHRNAPLTPEGRLRLCHRIASGWSVTAAAESMNISRQTAHKWWGRYRQEGRAGLIDRSSRPHRVPMRTALQLERQILGVRNKRNGTGYAHIHSAIDAYSRLAYFRIRGS